MTLGICLTDKKLVDEGLQLLELTDEQTLLEACQSDVNRFFKNEFLNGFSHKTV